MRRARTTLALLLRAAAAAWPPLDAALEAYATVHAAEAAKLRRGDASAKFLLVNAYHGLGNREHAVLSAFALALAQRKALFVDWPEQRCNAGATAGDAAACAGSRLEDLYEAPPFDWTLLSSAGDKKRLRVRVRGTYNFPEAAWRLSHGTEWQLVDADLNEAPWNGSAVVRTDHHFLHGVLCNRAVAASKLFPPDALAAQRALEAYLLRPAAPVRGAVARVLSAAGGCAVGLHLRRADFMPWDAGDVWPRLKPMLKGRAGGLFVAADDYSAPFRRALEAAAVKDGTRVVAAPELSAPGVTALAENHVLSECGVLVPTNASTFFNVAAVRATARAGVRGVFACPQAQAFKTPFGGGHLRCRFRPTCGFAVERGSSLFKHGQVDDDLVQDFFR